MKPNFLRPILLMGCLSVAACEDSIVQSEHAASEQNEHRLVAKIYKVQSTDHAETVRCFRVVGQEMSVLTTLKTGQLVDIVDPSEGLRRFRGDLWLQVYPRLTHRPGCYVNVNSLIPYS